MISEPFLKAVPVLEGIESAGYEAYFVGGSVRDLILGREIADVDIATSALPGELKMIFPKTTDVGIEHGTILVHYNGAAYEITTFRSESGYSDFRRPDQVSFIRSLDEDLQRRDFTMNAIAMDKSGRIIDPFGGRSDIERKRIATVGNPDDRFTEDALRMMRAVRFLSQLSFSIENRTHSSLIEHSSLLEKIAVERITAEFEKMLIGQNRRQALSLLDSTGIYQYLPGLGSFKGSMDRIASYRSENLSLHEMWVLLLYGLELSSDRIDVFLRKWKLPVQKMNKLKKLHSWLLYRIESEWNEETIYKAGLQTAIDAERMYECLFPDLQSSQKKIAIMHEKLPIKERADLTVTGHDLMAWFKKKQGPWLRDVLEEIEAAVIKGMVQNEKEKIRIWLNGRNPKSEEN